MMFRSAIIIKQRTCSVGMSGAGFRMIRLNRDTIIYPDYSSVGAIRTSIFCPFKAFSSLSGMA